MSVLGGGGCNYFDNIFKQVYIFIYYVLFKKKECRGRNLRLLSTHPPPAPLSTLNPTPDAIGIMFIKSCNYFVKGPEKTKIHLSVDSLDLPTSSSGNCYHFLEIRDYLSGSDGKLWVCLRTNERLCYIQLMKRLVTYSLWISLLHTANEKACYIQLMNRRVTYSLCIDVFHTANEQTCYIQLMNRRVTYS